MSARRTRLAAAALLAVLAVTIGRDARAQAPPPPGFETRQFTGGGLLFAIPRRSFADRVGAGIGFDAVGSGSMVRGGAVRLRSDVTLLYHLNRDQTVPAGRLVAGDDLTLGSSANLFHLVLGPELSWPKGRARPYGFGAVGFGTVWMRQKLSGHIDAGTERYQLDASKQSSMFTWSAGAGVRLRTAPGVWLDLGAELRDAIGASMITPDRVSTVGPRVNYDQGKLDATQWLLRLGFARSGR